MLFNKIKFLQENSTFSCTYLSTTPKSYYFKLQNV